MSTQYDIWTYRDRDELGTYYGPGGAGWADDRGDDRLPDDDRRL